MTLVSKAVKQSSRGRYTCFIIDSVSEKTKKRIYFGSHIRILLCSRHGGLSVPDVAYNVFGGMLNLALSITMVVL